MSARMTIVLDDEDLYRRLKIKAAEDGVPMKDLIERGIRLIVGEPGRGDTEGRAFDWAAYDAMLERIDQADAAAGSGLDALPEDLSDIKKHLYRKQDGRALRVAEDRAEYNAK
mgnify:CR=1 FL=1